ncbi:hypothetical protein AeRB84_008024 [Aphanomyces euteiches]|nr:hypothetical protein AeRB84_008024 [Aphanomyces euteiches]
MFIVTQGQNTIFDLQNETTAPTITFSTEPSTSPPTTFTPPPIVPTTSFVMTTSSPPAPPPPVTQPPSTSSFTPLPSRSSPSPTKSTPPPSESTTSRPPALRPTTTTPTVTPTTPSTLQIPIYMLPFTLPPSNEPDMNASNFTQSPPSVHPTTQPTLDDIDIAHLGHFTTRAPDPHPSHDWTDSFCSPDWGLRDYHDSDCSYRNASKATLATQTNYPVGAVTARLGNLTKY